MTNNVGTEMVNYDAVVIGGGAGGLSAGLVLGRSRRSVVVIDAGEPRNAPAAGVHALLALDGIAPAELLERGREDVRRYGGEVRPGRVAAVSREEDGTFLVTLDDGGVVRGRRLIVASGMVDELPEVEGIHDHWGRDVLHCPYCHGWEVRDKAIGILATGPMSVHQALLFRQWSSDITFFLNTTPMPPEEDVERMTARGIRIVLGEVAALESSGGRLSGVRLADGTVVEREALAVATTARPRADFLAGLGLVPVDHPSGMGQYLPAEQPTGRSEVEGVWLVGNIADISAQVGAAATAGALAGAHVNADLMVEETDAAVAARRRDAAGEFGGAGMFSQTRHH